MEDVLSFLNKAIREEHGNRVGLRTTDILEDGIEVERDTVWADAGVDSFGTTMVFLDMDEKYGCFNNEWFLSRTKEEWHTLPIREIVERVMNEGTIV